MPPNWASLSKSHIKAWTPFSPYTTNRWKPYQIKKIIIMKCQFKIEKKRSTFGRGLPCWGIFCRHDLLLLFFSIMNCLSLSLIFSYYFFLSANCDPVLCWKVRVSSICVARSKAATLCMEYVKIVSILVIQASHWRFEILFYFHVESSFIVWFSMWF